MWASSLTLLLPQPSPGTTAAMPSLCPQTAVKIECCALKLWVKNQTFSLSCVIGYLSTALRKIAHQLPSSGSDFSPLLSIFSVCQLHFQTQSALAVILASCSEGRHPIKSKYMPPFICPETFFVCLCLHLCPSLSQLHWEGCCTALLCPTVAICCTPGAGSEGYFSWIIGAESWGQFCMLLSKEGACVNAGRSPAWKWVSVCSFEMSPFSFYVLGPAPHQVCNQDRVDNASVSVWFVRL